MQKQILNDPNLKIEKIDKSLLVKPVVVQVAGSYY
jgi:hypothetical protein